MSTPAPPNPLANAVADFLATQDSSAHAGSRAVPATAPAAAPLDLASAYDKVLEHEALKAIPVAERVTLWHRFGRPIAGAMVCLAAGWIWFLPPAWLTPTPDQAVIWPKGPAGSNLLLVNAADAVESFRRNAGRLPLGAEADSVAPRVLMRALVGGGFELQAPDGTTLTAPAPEARAALGYQIVSPPGERQP